MFILVCLLPLLVMLYRFGGTAYSMLAPRGPGGVALEFAFYVSSLVSLMLGFPWSFPVFYMTDDVEKLLYLPVRPWQIVGAKFTISLIIRTCQAFTFCFRSWRVMGVKAGAGPPLLGVFPGGHPVCSGASVNLRRPHLHGDYEAL